VRGRTNPNVRYIKEQGTVIAALGAKGVGRKRIAAEMEV
jgi:hypothetical protein